MVLTIHDEATATTARLLTMPAARLTARELIRERVVHEVRQHNDAPGKPFPGLVRLSDETLELTGRLDPGCQVARAFESFDRNAFALVVDGTQVENLDQELVLSADSQITFLRFSAMGPRSNRGNS